MTREWPSTLVASGISLPDLWNHIPCMVYIMPLAAGQFISSHGVWGHMKSWKAHEHNHRSAENNRIDIGNCQQLWKEGNARINKVSAMRAALAKIVQKVRIWSNFESPGTDLLSEPNTYIMYHSQTRLSKRMHCLSHSQITDHSTTYSRFEQRVEDNTSINWWRLPLTRIHPWVAQVSKSQSFPATIHNTEWMDYCRVHEGRCTATPILDPQNDIEVYRYSELHYHCLQWHVSTYGWHFAICK